MIGLKDFNKALNLFGIGVKLPIMANHKLLGSVEIIGIRTECSSNNNKMYLVKDKGDYFWIYDYETDLTGP